MTETERTPTVLSVLLAAAVSFWLPATPALGLIAGTGDITPAYDDSLPWRIFGDLFIGNTADANLVVTNGSQILDVNDAFIAYTPASTATMLVTGLNSRWINSGNLFIGGSETQAGGAGILTISSGGRVEANDVTIWSTGSLTGNGTLTAASVLNRGTISPGNSIGTLTVQGDVTFWVDSTLEVEVDNSGNSDKLHVVGDVNIVGGTVEAVSTETITGTKEYTILDATHLTGRFDALDTGLLDLMIVDPNAELGYATNSIALRIIAQSFDLGIDGTPNQRELGVALQRIADANGTAITGALQQLPSLDAVRASYDQLAGQNRPPLAPIVASDTAKFMGIISNRLQGARGTVAKSLKDLSDMPLLAMARPDSLLGTGSTSDLTWDGFLWSVGRDTPEMTNEDWGAWAKLYGIFGDRKTDNGFPGYSYDVTGETFGIDVDLSDWMVGGFTGGTSKGDVEYDGLDDTADVRNTHFGLYSSISADGWYLNSIVTYSRIDIHTERPVDLTGETYTADFDGREMSGYAEVGFDWQPRSTWLIQPLVAMQVTFLHLDQYAENGYAGALVFEDQDYDSYKAALGVKATKELTLGRQGPPAIFQARSRWVHEFGDVLSSIDTRFEDVPPISWTVSDAEASRDSIVAGAGLGIRLSREFRLFVDYDRTFNSDKTVNVISGAVEYRW
jgi:T5SS/PEP-CTERM-associated repeat protein